MCEVQPGPRCSNHAGQSLARAKAKMVSTEAACTAAQATVTAPEEYAVLANARTEARAAHLDALTQWRTTPAGQAELEEDIATCRAGGYATSVDQLETMLADAKAAREQQVRDLHLKEAQAARLAAITPEEEAFLESFDNRLAVAEQELGAAEITAAANEEQARPGRAADEVSSRAEVDTLRAARLEVEAAGAEMTESLRVYRNEASRLYQDAGAGNGRYYADDMIDSTLGTGRFDVPRQPGAVRPVSGIKTKRQGPDVAATKAAKAASATDEGFLAAQAVVASKYQILAGRERIHTTAQRAVQATARRHLDEVPAQHHAAQELKALRERRDSLVAARTDAQLRVSAGLGVTPTERLNWSSVSDKIRQNPDGTLNIWSRQDPSEGFPNGRYLQATGVSAINGGMYGQANSLVMSNGINVHPSEHLYRNTGGLQSQGGKPVLVLAEAAPGATRPVLPAAGWGYFVDSTD